MHKTLKSRRIFEDLSRNYQQAQASGTLRQIHKVLQQAQQFGNLGQMKLASIGGSMAGLGAQTQATWSVRC
jgi:hypothetical protein